MYHGKYLVLYHIDTLKYTDNKINYFGGKQFEYKKTPAQSRRK